MSHPFCKYVGTYSVLAEYDRSTNDWVRDEYGNLDESFEDFYIPLEDDKGRILYYYDKILILYITGDSALYRKLKNIQKKNPVKKAKELGIHDLSGSGEGFIHINEKDLPKYLEYITPKTTNKKRDPFDYRNLPVPYKIPKKDLKDSEEIISKINSQGNFKFANLSRKFIKTVCNVDLSDFRKSGLTFSNFIHQNGKWEEFLIFLKKNINKS